MVLPIYFGTSAILNIQHIIFMTVQKILSSDPLNLGVQSGISCESVHLVLRHSLNSEHRNSLALSHLRTILVFQSGSRLGRQVLCSIWENSLSQNTEHYWIFDVCHHWHKTTCLLCWKWDLKEVRVKALRESPTSAQRVFRCLENVIIWSYMDEQLRKIIPDWSLWLFIGFQEDGSSTSGLLQDLFYSS